MPTTTDRKPGKEAPPYTATNLSGLSFIFRALRHRNYRLFFFGQGVSLIGTWISRLATSWLVYKLTNSAFMLGLVGFVGQIPTFLVTPLGGVLADRWNRRRALMVTQVVFMATSLGLAYFALAGTIRLAHVLILTAIQGAATAMDAPLRQAFVVEMVEAREDLSGAIALNSSIFNGARLIGPSIAGVLIALFGEGWCFFIDGVSFLAVIGALLAMHISVKAPERKRQHVLHDFREGFNAAYGFAPIRAILLLVSLLSLVGAPYMVLLPIFADRILGGGAMTLGFLTAATGLGALSGALYLAMRRTVVGLGRFTSYCAAVFGVSLIAFGLSKLIWLSLPVLVIAGFSMMVCLAGGNTIVQTIVDDHLRGRVMSFFALSFFGAMPIGSLIAGEIARRIGAPLTVMAGGLLCMVGAILFRRTLPKLRPLLRSIYIARGILPPLADGLDSPAEIVPPLVAVSAAER